MYLGLFSPLNPSKTTGYAPSAFYPSLRFTLSLQPAFYTQSAFYPWQQVKQDTPGRAKWVLQFLIKQLRKKIVFLMSLETVHQASYRHKHFMYIEYFMESAGVRYLHTSCWYIRNRTGEHSEWVRFLIQKQRVRKYHTKHFPCGIICVYYIHTEKFIILAAFLFPIFPKIMLKLPLHTTKWERSRSISLFVKTFVKSITRVRIWGNPRTTRNPNCLFWVHILKMNELK